MKLLFLFFYFQISTVNSQTVDSTIIGDKKLHHWTDTIPHGNYSFVDTKVLMMQKKHKNIEELAKDITIPFETDTDKIRAIFRWLTENIEYDTKTYRKAKGKTIKFTYNVKRGDSKEIKAQKLEKHYYDYATKCLKNKKAVCEGYATLFYELCKYNGIKSDVVVGYTDKLSQYVEGKGKVEVYSKTKRVPTNHTWNRVLIDDEWYFIDVTWASGYCDLEIIEYTKSLANYYYLTRKDKLFPTHIVNEKGTKKRNEGIGN